MYFETWANSRIISSKSALSSFPVRFPYGSSLLRFAPHFLSNDLSLFLSNELTVFR